MTHRVRGTGSLRENVMQKAMTQMQDAGWVGRDLPTIAMTVLTAFWWGSGPQMLLVQQLDS